MISYICYHDDGIQIIKNSNEITMQHSKKLDAGMWRYHANRMDARRSQFDLGRVDAYN